MADNTPKGDLQQTPRPYSQPASRRSADFLIMQIADLVEIQQMPRALDLGNLRDIRENLDASGGAPSLLSASDVTDIVQEHIAFAGPEGDPVKALIDHIVTDETAGAVLMCQGPAGSGKTHLLSLAALLLEYPAIRELYRNTHEGYDELFARLDRKKPPLAVPVPLGEHRPEEEHLEDIIFDCVERELARPKYDIQVPLSENSYALDLIERHIVPRYSDELDEFTAERSGARSWANLAKNDPAAAVTAAKAFAQKIGYPLDFRQSRVERIARLSELIDNRAVSGVVWFIDDLWQFLTAAGQKAVRSDLAFVEFLAQRTRLENLYLMITARAALEELTGVEPYLLAGIRDAYDATFTLDAAGMRDVAHKRTIEITDREAFERATAETEQIYRAAFGEVSFDADRLAQSYPLHPDVEKIVETVYRKCFSEADALVDFSAQLKAANGVEVMSRPSYRLVSLPDVLDVLRSRLAAHPRASDYVLEVLEYFENNASRLAPQSEETIIALTKSLIVLALASTPATVTELLELTGVDNDRSPLVDRPQAEELLDQMRLRGNYVDMRSGAGEDVYVVDIHTNLSELARRRLMTVRSGLLEEDPRLWRAAQAAASSPDFPLAHLHDRKVLEIVWRNSPRHVTVETEDLLSFTARDMHAHVAELSGPECEESCRVLIAPLFGIEQQVASFQQASEAARGHRFAHGVIAWFPRSLDESEVDSIRQFAACRQIVQEPSSAHEEPEVADRISQELSRLEPEVARIIQQAYRQGHTLTAPGVETGLQQLPGGGMWPDLLSAVVEGALERVYPDFEAIAPQRPVTGTGLVDRLVSEFIAEGSLIASDDPDLSDRVRDVLEPLGLVRTHNGGIALDVDSSKPAAEIITRVRQRDKSAQTERGRPVDVTDLGAHLAKSPMGLTPELFEVTLAALLKTGVLVAVDADGGSMRFEDIDGAIRDGVTRVARAPLLGMSEWKTITRIAKIVLDVTVPRPDHTTQAAVFEGLVDARKRTLEGLESMRDRLQKLMEDLRQDREKWAESLDVLDELEEFFDLVHPGALPAEGLRRMVAEGERFLQRKAGPTRLALLLREADAIRDFLENWADDVVAIRDYLLSDDLHLENDLDLRTRRKRLLDVIDRGEAMISEGTTLQRLTQIFMATYKRRYMSWHHRCNRAAIFEQYRSLRNGAEMRALAQLQRLNLEVDGDTGRAFEMLEAEMDRRCTCEDLNTALDERPICPECGLRLDEDPDLIPPEDILEIATEGLHAYVDALRDPEFVRALEEYAYGLQSRGELRARMERVAHLDERPNPRQILTLFSDDLINHINRMLSGKRMKPRNFAELREALSGRTLTKEEARELFKKWLEDEDEDNGDELIHIVP